MPSATLRNHLLDRLSPDDRAAVLAASSPFEFELGHVFSEAGDDVAHVHFVLSGIVSAVAGMRAHQEKLKSKAANAA